MLKIGGNGIIYVVCPAHIVTGGAEAVHQLVDKLRKVGHDARIVVTPRVDNPTLIQYRYYDVKFSVNIEDDHNNLLITTEVNPAVLARYCHIQKALWWLSVDNHQNLRDQFDFADPRNLEVVHLVQSFYAERFLQGQGVTSVYRVTDYLHPDYLYLKRGAKLNLIVYTPVKGSEAYVDRLRRLDSTLSWIPLQGMIRKLHAQTLRQAKVYVDFGSHPGKDRQPREAVANGCCVLVGLRGSACFNEDLPIPLRYKFDLEAFDEEAIIATIKRCLQSHEECYREFSDYANIVKNEERVFEREVVNLVGFRPSRQTARIFIIGVNVLNFVKENKAFIALRGVANELMPLWLMLPLKRKWWHVRV